MGVERDFSAEMNEQRLIAGALEGGRFGLAFASGCAATTTILHLLSAGDHVVAGDDLYGGTYRIFERVMKQFSLDVTYVDPTRPEAFAEAMRPETKLVWVETPTNPLLKICDIAAVADLCKKRRVWLAVDNLHPIFGLRSPVMLRSGLYLSIVVTVIMLDSTVQLAKSSAIRRSRKAIRSLRWSSSM